MSFISKQRMIQNQAVFRHENERVQKNFDDIKKQAEETNQGHLISSDDTVMHFLCECSDEDCRKRIRMTPSMYQRIQRTGVISR